MFVNGLKTFKVVTADPGTGSPGGATGESGNISGEYPYDIPADDGQGFLSNGDVEELASAPIDTGNPLDEYTMGDTGLSGVAADPGGAQIEERIVNAVPTMEEIAIQMGSKFDQNIHIVEGRFERGIEQLTTIATRYQELLFSGGMSSSEAAVVQRRIDACQQGLAKATNELSKVAARRADLENNIWPREIQDVKDYNGDNMIGSFQIPGSLGIGYDAEGKPYYVDLATGRPTTNRTPAPNFSPKLFGGAVEINEINPPTFENDEVSDAGRAPDLVLRLTDNYPSFNGPAIKVFVPEFLWVKWDQENGRVKLAPDGNLIAYDHFNAATGEQEIPEDKSQWVQYQVSSVDASSPPSGRTAVDGTPLYDHQVVFSVNVDGEEIPALTMKITGIEDHQASGDPVPGPAAAEIPLSDAGFSTASGTIGAVPVDDGTPPAHVSTGRYYTAPSSVGLEITGEGVRASAVEVNAAIKSTARWIFDDFLSAVGLEGETYATPSGQGEMYPVGEGEDAEGANRIGPTPAQVSQYAWEDNVGLYQGEHISFHYYNGLDDPRVYRAAPERAELLGWETDPTLRDLAREGGLPAALDYPPNEYSGGHSIYVPDTADGQSDQHSPFATIKSGVFINNLHGIIKGSDYNDVIVALGANEIPELVDTLGYEKPTTRETDPDYTTVVDAGGGHNAVIAHGRQNIVAKQASFFHWKGGAGDDQAFISTLGSNQLVSGERSAFKNPKNYVHSEGGEISIFNPEETIETESESNTVQRTYRDDYYDIVGGSVRFGNPLDSDVPARNTQGTTFNGSHIDEQYSTYEGELYNVIHKVPEVNNEAQAEADQWMSENGPAAQNEAEMDSFFGEMNGALGEFDAERTGSTGSSGSGV